VADSRVYASLKSILTAVVDTSKTNHFILPRDMVSQTVGFVPMFEKIVGLISWILLFSCFIAYPSSAVAVNSFVSHFFIQINSFSKAGKVCCNHITNVVSCFCSIIFQS